MDEMWEFIAQPRILDFIVEAWKTFRKERTIVIGVTQNLAGDIARNERVAGAIMQNTETWFLLDQGDDQHARSVAKLLSLTDGQNDLLRGLKKVSKVEDNGDIINYRECLLIRAISSKNANSGIIQIRPMPEEYWIFTTDPEEAMLMEDVTGRFGGSVLEAARYLGKRFPGGLALQRKKEIQTGAVKLEGFDDQK
jgi:TraG P-loop domain